MSKESTASEQTKTRNVVAVERIVFDGRRKVGGWSLEKYYLVADVHMRTGNLGSKCKVKWRQIAGKLMTVV